MKTVLTAALAVFFALPVRAEIVLAEPAPCGPYISVSTNLRALWKEEITEKQVRSPEEAINRYVAVPWPENIQALSWYFWRNMDAGTWTVTSTDGRMICVHAAGKRYEGETIEDVVLGPAH